MIKGLAGEDINEDALFKPTIVLDAGIATEDNVKWLKDKPCHYIIVFHKKKKAIPSHVTMIAVKEERTQMRWSYLYHPPCLSSVAYHSL